MAVLASGSHRDRRLRGAGRSATSACCATSASSPCSTSRSRWRGAAGPAGGAGLGRGRRHRAGARAAGGSAAPAPAREALAGDSRAGDGRCPRRAGAEPRAGPSRSRYSIFVGLAFLVLIVGRDRRTRSATRRRRHPRASTRTIADMPLPEFAVPDAPRRSTPTRTSPRTTARPRANPCPADDRRTPACEIAAPGRDPRLRPLRQAAGDLVLVHPGRRLPAHPGRLRRRRRALPRPGQLPLDRRPRRPRRRSREIVREHGWTIPVGWDRDGAVSNLYRVGGCPTVAFAYPGGILAFAKIGERRRQLSEPASSTADVDALLAASRGARRGQSR